MGCEGPNAEGPSSPLLSHSPVPFELSFMEARDSNVGILLMPGILHTDEPQTLSLSLQPTKSPSKHPLRCP